MTTIVTEAFEIQERYGRGKRPSDADLAAVFTALDVLYGALSKVRQRKLRPPEPKKRGRPTITPERYGWWVRHIIEREKKNGASVPDATATMQRELESYGIAAPTDEETIKNYRKRSYRPHLLPKK